MMRRNRPASCTARCLSSPTMAREGLLLRGVEALVTKEDHAVVEEGPSDRGHARRVEVGAQVDAVDLGAQRAGDGTDLDRHRSHVGSPGVAQYRFLR
jgi:hypothetical protein